MQRDLSELEQLWGLAVQSAGFGVWDLDCISQSVRYSPQWKALLGYADADEPDPTSTWRSRVHPDDLPPMLAALTAHLADDGSPYEAEFRLRAADGSYRWVRSRGRVVERNAQGSALRVVGTLTDETDRRELEALRIARDRAEAANLAKTQFLSRMSHELRTPLNAVLGFAQLLSASLGQNDGDIAKQRRQVGHIEQAGWHLLAMIDDVLDMSRAETGQLAVEIEAVAVAPLWQAVRDMMGPTADQRGVRLTAAPLPAQARVLADPVRLKQVLTNLLSNAIKYNREGGSVHFDAIAHGAGWRFAVGDTGFGIPADQMPHLFEPFNRLGRGRSAIEGVGIGLALTRWLVERMSGAIAVQSELGVGTTVTVDLPAA